MMIPAVMFIEIALDELKGADPSVVHLELKEFFMLGNRIQQLSDALKTTDAALGYLIGLHTARTLLQTMPAAVKAGVVL
jgi:hypothetical protein